MKATLRSIDSIFKGRRGRSDHRDIAPISISPTGALAAWSGETRIENPSVWRHRDSLAPADHSVRRLFPGIEASF